MSGLSYRGSSSRTAAADFIQSRCCGRPTRKWADPVFAHGPPGILSRFRDRPVTREHRIGHTRKRYVPRNDLLAHAVIDAARPELLELVVQVEDQRRSLEAARRPACARMQATTKNASPPKLSEKCGSLGSALTLASGGWPSQSSLCVSESRRSQRQRSNPSSSRALSSSNRTASE